MSQQLLKRIEEFRKQNKLPILTLCKMMDVHNVTYHRWKNAGKITGAYQRIVEDFLAKSGKVTPAAVDSSKYSFHSKNTSDIAVIGIACYYPGASNVYELWENILARRVQFRRMLDQRLPLSEYHSEDLKSTDKTYLSKAAFIDNFIFDWGKLRIPKKTVESTDIAHWLALDIALKTFENAGYKLTDIPLQNTGVIVGNTLTGEQTRSQTLRLRWPYVQKALNATLGHLGKSVEERSQIASEMEKIFKSAFYPVTEDSLAGGLANTIAGRICNYLNLKGGGYIVDGACSSSLLAVATAADALKMGNMDLALAGGVDISLDPFELVGFARAGALAKDQMRVYDQKANGFLPGEGCGFVLLKRLNDAIRDKNYIYAVIKGWGISSDGRGGIMEPSSSGQSFAIGRAYKDLEYKIADVDFVEGHGTGTTKGDRVELEGISISIDKTTKKMVENKRRCGVTSFKSIVGHTKAAAGIGGLIKAVLAVNQRILPPTANCTHPNDVFQDKAKNIYPLIQGGVLPINNKVRAGISSAGFGGINSHITVESYDTPKAELKPRIDERALFVSHQETEVFVFSSRTVVYLKNIIRKFKEELRNISIAEMADLAALLNKKVKNRLPIKAAIVTDSPEHLYEALILLENELDKFQVEEGNVYRIKAKDPATHIILSHSMAKGRVGFLYPGQGSQRLNMARTIVERYSWARDLFKLSQLPLVEKIYRATDKFLTKEEQGEFEKQLSDTKITQPAIVLSSLVWTEFLSRLGIEPQISLGHSLGELTAFYKAGALSKEALIKFAQLRGNLMASDSRSSGSMVSLFCSKEKAEALIKHVSGNIVIANINSPKQIVISGGKKEIEKVKELAKKEDITAYQLNVSNAFHSSYMKEAADKILNNKILPDTFKTGDIKVYSCVSGEVVSGKVNLKEYFSKQVISPVNFVGAIKAAAKDCDVMIELGTGRVLTDLVKAIDEKIVCLPLESFAGNDKDLNIALAEIFVHNIPVKFEELYRNRLIKKFVRASRKKFIENQCERPLKIDNQVLKNTLLPVVLEVKKDEEEQEEIIPGGLPETGGKDKVTDLLLALTHEITGFDKESISLDLRLLDDLNLDSIKAAELIGKAARTLGIPGQVDPSQLSNNTLGQIRDKLNELVTQSRIGQVKESVNDILKRYQDKTWVRNFILDLKAEEIKTKNVNQLKDLKNIVFLSGKSQESLVKEIAVSLRGVRKATKQSLKVQQMYFDETQPKTQKDGHIDCLITILPPIVSLRVPPMAGRSNLLKDSNCNELDRTSLKSIIQQMHQITELANSNRLDKNSFVVFVQFGGGATAIASTLFLERPDLKVRIIDFDKNIDENKISQKIIDELQTYDLFNSVVYDAQLIRKVIYYENSNPVEYKKRNIIWSSKDVVLVTGGGKGITAQCALEFARSTKAQMALIGRSPVPKKNEDNEINHTLKQFEKEDLTANYYSCDVTNEKDVFSTIEQIEKKLGKITGFIHGAGLNSLKRLKQSSEQEAFQEALPKVMGAVNVCKALSEPPKLIAAITSIIGITGMEGSGWYGLSNEILNLYLQTLSSQRKSGSFPAVVAIAYSVWDEVGMGAKLGSINRLAERGIGAIPVIEGVKHFRQLIEGDPGCQQVIVAARVAGIATWKSSAIKTNQFRFIEKVEYFLPGVELIAQVQLNVKDDPYLLDHNWKGSLLFPFVFGFEAMAQAVAYVLGIDGFDYIKAKDINLQRPIPVPQDSGTTIEIHAQVLETVKSNSIQEVKVEIYSQDTAYKEPHFSAIFEIVSAPIITNNLLSVIARSEATKQSLSKKINNVIDLDMQTDIYGPILFQGKMFQGIEKIHELAYDEKKKEGECLLTSVYNKSTNGFFKEAKKFNGRFLIGEPFFIDTLLQSMQLIIPQDVSLPRDIEAIELMPIKGKSSIEYAAESKIKRLDVDYYRGDAQVIKDGLLVKIKNCRLKILDTIIDNPSANDLVNPAKRDQKNIEDRMVSLSNELGFILPVIKCLHDEQLKTASKDLRHKIEFPLIKEAVEELLHRNKKSVKNFRIKWLKTGKPFVEIKGSNVGVSVSHVGTFLVIIAGFGEQGCDIEEVKERNKAIWLEMLGKEKFNLLGSMISNEAERNKKGTMLWSTSESLRKFTNQDIKFNLSIQREDLVCFEVELSGDKKLILSVPIRMTRGGDKILSFVCSFLTENLKKISGLKTSTEFSYDEDIFKMDVSLKGPEGQMVYAKRFPVTFKNTQNFSKNVYFTNYFNWIGEIREYSLYPIRHELVRLLETGEWGMATNHVKLKILGTLKTDDVIEGRLWVHRISGEKDSVVDLKFDWLKVLPEGQLEKVAISEQRISWIRIIGHGEGELDSFPGKIKTFLDTLKPRSLSVNSSSTDAFDSKNLNIGSEKKNFKRISFGGANFLSEDIFLTSIEESNLVGNIYFTNYTKWLGKVSDNYFKKIIPDYYLGIDGNGEFQTLTCEIYHLMEAMPFDTIKVRMYLNKVYENGLELYFEFFNVAEGLERKRLAYATQKIIFGKVVNRKFGVEILPERIADAVSAELIRST